MKKLFTCFVLAVSLFGCVEHHCRFDSPHGAVYVGSDVCYKQAMINGVPYRFYYRWTPQHSWRYDHSVWYEDR